MTPHDELMALAGKVRPGDWTVTDGPSGYQHRVWKGPLDVPVGTKAACDVFTSSDAAFIAAACNFVRSDAFRAMVRDAARGRYVITRGKLPTKTTAGYHYEDGVSYATPAEAIDAAASGAGEE